MALDVRIPRRKRGRCGRLIVYDARPTWPSVCALFCAKLAGFARDFVAWVRAIVSNRLTPPKKLFVADQYVEMHLGRVGLGSLAMACQKFFTRALQVAAYNVMMYASEKSGVEISREVQEVFDVFCEYRRLLTIPSTYAWLEDGGLAVLAGSAAGYGP